MLYLIYEIYDITVKALLPKIRRLLVFFRPRDRTYEEGILLCRTDKYYADPFSYSFS